jgi:hypothetical protein
MASTIFTLADACLSSSELTCPACEQGLKEPVTLSCGHSYCRDPCICAVMTHGMACALEAPCLAALIFFPAGETPPFLYARVFHPPSPFPSSAPQKAAWCAMSP